MVGGDFLFENRMSFGLEESVVSHASTVSVVSLVDRSGTIRASWDESGLASSGIYHQDVPGTHGLWPQVDKYGTSQCAEPKGSLANPTKVYDCYKNDGDGLVEFETHEWTKHGECAGVQDAEDFFTQICNMSTQPISIMTTVKQSGGDLNKMESALTSAGYSVFSLDTSNQQVLLSACASLDGQWKLANQSQFGTVCSNSTNTTTSLSPITLV